MAPALRRELDAPVAHDRHGRPLELVHAHEPLLADERLHRRVAAVAGRDGVVIILHLDERPRLVEVRDHSLAFAVDAIVLTARESNPASTGEIVQLWAVPSADGEEKLDVAVANVESDTTRYRLTVTQGDDVLSDSVVEVPQGSSATVTVRPRAAGVEAERVEAELRSVVVDDEPLRRVWVDPASVRMPRADDAEATGQR